MRLLTALLLLALSLPAFAQDAPVLAEHSKFKARSNYTPQWSHDGKRVLFNAHIDGRWRVVAVNIDGSGMTALSPAEQDVIEPTWSPDGRYLAYVVRNTEKKGDIYVAAGDGSSARQLTRDPAHEITPRFSPDSKRIAYISSVSGKPALWLMNADGSGAKQVLDPQQHPVAGRIAWSPDGEHIVFYSTTDGNPMSSDNEWQPRVVEVSSGKVRTLDRPRRDSNPSWSKDGLILFDANPDGSWASGEGQFELLTMKADGSGHRTQLTRNTRNDWGPAWSPDGRQIAYCSGFNDQYEIFIMDADGKNQRRVTYNVHPPDSIPQFEPEKK